MTPTKMRQGRRKQTAEDFTPFWLIDEMLGKLEESAPSIFTEHDKTFLDPACGNGNMLVCVLLRKLKKGASALQALQTTFGADLMEDNVKEARLRLLHVVTSQTDTPTEITSGMIRAVLTNIVCADGLKYDFSFEPIADADTTEDLATIKDWKARIKVLMGALTGPDSTLIEFLNDSPAEIADAKNQGKGRRQAAQNVYDFGGTLKAFSERLQTEYGWEHSSDRPWVAAAGDRTWGRLVKGRFIVDLELDAYQFGLLDMISDTDLSIIADNMELAKLPRSGKINKVVFEQSAIQYGGHRIDWIQRQDGPD